MRRFFAWYGAGPLHLCALVGSLALAGYAAALLFPRNPVGVGAWLVGAVVGHDLILLPLYALADRSVARVLRHRRHPLPFGAYLNHLRIPAALSALSLLVFAPLILRLAPTFQRITDRSIDPYLAHWLLITAVLFAGSALVLVVRIRKLRTEGQRAPSANENRGS